MRSAVLPAIVVASVAALACSSSSKSRVVTAKSNDRRSQFADEVTSFAASLPGAKALATSGPLRWDFSTERTIGYDYAQRVRVAAAAGRKASRFSAKGTLLFKVRANRTADIVIKDMMAKDEGKPDQPIPGLLMIQGIKPDGTKAPGKRGNEWYVRALFPLPDKALAVGESAELPFHVPFDANGTTLYGKGTVRLTFSRYVTVDGHTCAQLDTVVTVPGLHVPKEIKGTYEFSVHGNGVIVFDLQDKRVAAARIALMLHMNIEFAQPSSGPPMADAERKITMDQDQLISVTRNKTKDRPGR